MYLESVWWVAHQTLETMRLATKVGSKHYTFEVSLLFWKVFFPVDIACASAVLILYFRKYVFRLVAPSIISVKGENQFFDICFTWDCLPAAKRYGHRLAWDHVVLVVVGILLFFGLGNIILFIQKIQVIIFHFFNNLALQKIENFKKIKFSKYSIF